MRGELLVDRLRRVGRADADITERHVLLGEHGAGPLSALAGGGLGVVLVAFAEQQMTDRGRRDEQDELSLGVLFPDAAHHL